MEFNLFIFFLKKGKSKAAGTPHYLTLTLTLEEMTSK